MLVLIEKMLNGFSFEMLVLIGLQRILANEKILTFCTGI
jgi:hypothetical protein